MPGHVFLVKKNDLYLIGKANNFERKMKKIRPDKIIATIETDYPVAFEARLLRRYRKSRFPDSSYFDFNENQLKTCKEQFTMKGNIPRTLVDEFYIALSACIIILAFSLLSLIKIGINMPLAISISFALSSFPMCLLFIIGNFGGYQSSDLEIFSSL